MFSLFHIATSATVPTTKEIKPGVFMPYVNLGGVKTKPSNYTAWLEVGGRGLDTAYSYGDDVQQDMGAAVAKSGVKRSEMFITSKVPCCPRADNKSGWFDCSKPRNATADAEHDIAMLGVNHVDLLLLHWPCGNFDDTLAAYRAMEPLVASGKARALGISNFNAAGIKQLFAAGLTVPPRVNQCGFSVGNHDSPDHGSDLDTLAACVAHNITYSAYSPLGGLSHVDVLHNPDVLAVAEAHGKSAAQVALRWVVQQGVVAVTASTKAEYDVADLGIFDWALTDDEMARLMAVGAAQ